MNNCTVFWRANNDGFSWMARDGSDVFFVSFQGCNALVILQQVKRILPSFLQKLCMIDLLIVIVIGTKTCAWVEIVPELKQGRSHGEREDADRRFVLCSTRTKAKYGQAMRSGLYNAKFQVLNVVVGGFLSQWKQSFFRLSWTLCKG